jgi:hypothetical protein
MREDGSETQLQKVISAQNFAVDLELSNARFRQQLKFLLTPNEH